MTSAVVNGITQKGELFKDAAAQTDAVLDAVDWIHVMSYDDYGGRQHSPYELAEAGADYWENTRGVPAEKIVLGVPFYGRPDGIPYEELLRLDAEANKKDMVNVNGIDIYYNGFDTIQKKARFVKDNLGGIMIWEITQDTGETGKSLLTAIGEVLR